MTLPNTRRVLSEDRKYQIIAFTMTVVHIAAMPLMVVVMVEFSSYLTRMLFAAARRMNATRRP